TRENAAPQLTPSTQKRIRLVDAQPKEVTVSVHHPDALTWNYHLYGDTEGVSAKREGDNIIITFRKVLSKGSYKLGIKVADKFGSADLLIPFDVVENHKPLNILQPEIIYLPLSKEVYEMALSPYFEDPDGDILSYEVKNHSNSLVKATVVEDKLKVEALQNGTAHLEIIAKDLDGNAARMKVEIKVVNDDIVYLVYPVPVVSNLNIRLNDNVFTAKISIYTSMGVEKMNKFVSVREESDRQVVLDMSKFEVGTYLLEVSANGKVFKQNIIKN
ncbi:MAG: T9SS type A sorting domain-containing protein, partial [Clostridiaceae bacterium]|nr:T9SS type A sorting domain-containing protein [Clostridiaceae bacterium]